jgi:hypothetical protein
MSINSGKGAEFYHQSTPAIGGEDNVAATASSAELGSDAVVGSDNSAGCNKRPDAVRGEANGEGYTDVAFGVGWPAASWDLF